MKVEYEDSKCVCCKKSYVSSLLMTNLQEKDENKNFVICLPCAKNIHKFVDEMKGR